MLKQIPIPDEFRHFLGRKLLQFRAWQRARQVERQIRQSAAPVIKRLRRIKKSLPPGKAFIGILLTEHLGDIVACEPVIPWLKREHPDSFLIWLAMPAYAGLLRSHPQLDTVEEIGSLTACKHVIQAGVFDRFVDLNIHGKSCPVFQRDYFKSWGNADVDIKNYYFHGALLEAMTHGAGLRTLHEQPRLFLAPDTIQTVAGLKLPAIYVVIHARSTSAIRNWRDDYLNELVGILIQRFGLAVVEIGLHPAITCAAPGVINLCGKLSMVASAEVIRRATYFIGIDSGPAHIANACQIPSVILLGHHDVYRTYMPYTGFLRDHANMMVIQWNGAVADIPVSEVVHRFEMVRLGVPTIEKVSG